jgi:hypothetical protein
MEAMTLTRRVHFLIEPKRFTALEQLARERRKATGGNTTPGTLLREAVDEYLAKHQGASKAHSQRRQGIRKASTAR